MELTEQTLNSRRVFDGRLLHLDVDDIRLPDGGEAVREVVRHPGGVCVLPLHDDGTVSVVRQFRYPYKEVTTELPAGKLEPGEDPFDAIRRELKEEIGATAARWDALGYIMPSVGYTDEMLYLYLARDLTFGGTHLDEDEFLEPFKLPFAEALSQAADGRINDAKTLSALFRADQKMREERNG